MTMTNAKLRTIRSGVVGPMVGGHFGLPIRDPGKILGISCQRFSQPVQDRLDRTAS